MADSGSGSKPKKSNASKQQQQQQQQPKCTNSRSEVTGILLAGSVALPAMLAYFSVLMPRVTNWLAIDPKLAADPTYRLLFALRWLAPVCLTVVVCIQAVATCRLFTPAIDGRTPHRLTDLFRSILQNTVEQALLMTLNLLALSQNLAPEMLAAIPMVVALFVTGRLVFAAGYVIWPTRRALGFVLTFMPNVVMAVYNVRCLIRV